MDTKELFLTIQNSTDYKHEKHGIDWKYIVNHEERRVYVLVQETKTKQDWFYNFLAFPVPAKLRGETVWIHAGWKFLAEKLMKLVEEDMKDLPDYDYVFTGWSGGAAVAEYLGAMLIYKHGIDTYRVSNPKKAYFVGFAQPAYCYTLESLYHITASYYRYVNYLYDNDWIRYFTPFCKRDSISTIEPDFEPKTLDERHRVYGKATLRPKEI